MPVVITSCTNRKRVRPLGALTAAEMRPGDLTSVATCWVVDLPMQRLSFRLQTFTVDVPFA